MNTINSFRAVLLVLLPLSLSGISADESIDKKEQKKKQPCVFSVHDSNQDGYLDKKEYLLFLEKYYRKMHRNSGKAHLKSERLVFEDVDTNSDLKLSEDEMITAIQKQRQQRKRYRYRYRGGRLD